MNLVDPPVEFYESTISRLFYNGYHQLLNVKKVTYSLAKTVDVLLTDSLNVIDYKILSVYVVLTSLALTGKLAF